MDRLTQHTRYGWQFSGLPTLALDLDSHETGIYNKAAQRLAQYESTGLMPDEIPHWIPVSERLPKVWRNENGEPIEFNVMLPDAEEATTLCFNGSQWFEFDWSNMEISGYYTVAYWMPLPQPPKGEKQ